MACLAPAPNGAGIPPGVSSDQLPLAGQAGDGRRVSLAAPGRWDHPSPDTECRCGIYAVADLQALRPYLAERSSARAFSRALGIVSLWGKVVRHEQGWRAARGYPARLWLPAPEARGRRPSESEEIARGFADYGIPVELVEADSSSELVDYLSEIDYSSDSLPRAS